jgi:hypothetical protein
VQVEEEAGSELVQVEQTTQNIVQRELPVGLQFERSGTPITWRGVTGPLSQFVGAGITVLVMTDCDTVNGILGLVRQGKGGVLNYYEDRMLKEIDQMR